MAEGLGSSSSSSSSSDAGGAAAAMAGRDASSVEDTARAVFCDEASASARAGVLKDEEEKEKEEEEEEEEDDDTRIRSAKRSSGEAENAAEGFAKAIATQVQKEGNATHVEGPAQARATSTEAGASEEQQTESSLLASDEKTKLPATSSEAGADGSHPWQAVWDANRGAWYFWNAVTQETTWENPLGKKVGQSSEAYTSDLTTGQATLSDEEVALASGIDPDLAFLDPALYAIELRQARHALGGQEGGGTAAAYRMAGAFDSRTGRFVPQDRLAPGGQHDVARFGQAAQADRQLGAFFDVEQFRTDGKRSADDSVDPACTADDRETDANGRIIKRARPTRKELKHFKERAKEKKAAKHAWLRS